MQAFIFNLHGQRYGIPLDLVQRVISAIEITHLPGAPDHILGIINIQGKIIPVIHIRKTFGLPHKELELEDIFIIAQTKNGTLAMVVDSVEGVMGLSPEVLTPIGETLTIKKFIGVAKTGKDMILIHNLEDRLGFELPKNLEPINP